MTAEQAVKMIDPTARVCNWSDGGYWVKGNGWETKITYSEQRGWELAVEEIASVPAHITTCSICRGPVVNSNWHDHPCE